MSLTDVICAIVRNEKNHVGGDDSVLLILTHVLLSTTTTTLFALNQARLQEDKSTGIISFMESK
jgi:hypothetical protein